MKNQDTGEDTTVVRLIYAGDPGKKDLLNGLLLALKDVNFSANKFELNIVGVAAGTFSDLYFNGGSLPVYIKCHGRVPMEKVPEYYSLCDFSVLIRENKRYAHAGFPTKLVESFMAKVPIITNLTSDIGEYVKSGYNGFIIDGPSKDSILECLVKISQIDPIQIKELKENAYKTALNSFSYTAYTKSLPAYFDKLQ